MATQSVGMDMRSRKASIRRVSELVCLRGKLCHVSSLLGMLTVFLTVWQSGMHVQSLDSESICCWVYSTTTPVGHI